MSAVYHGKYRKNYWNWTEYVNKKSTLKIK